MWLELTLRTGNGSGITDSRSVHARGIQFTGSQLLIGQDMYGIRFDT
jgi:hypothetical protein